MAKRTVVCLCGSTRFEAAFVKACREETLQGKIVLSVGLFGHKEGIDMEGEVKRMLDELHFDKIAIADEILVLNVGGYIGSSTRNEIAFAAKLGKRIRYLVDSEVGGGEPMRSSSYKKTHRGFDCHYEGIVGPCWGLVRLVDEAHTESQAVYYYACEGHAKYVLYGRETDYKYEEADTEMIPKDETLLKLERVLNEVLWDQLRIIADRLEDLGDMQQAEAYRWLAVERKVPMRFEDRWHWRIHQNDLPLSHQLPYDIMIALQMLPPRIGFDWHDNASLAEAYSRAAQAVVFAAQTNQEPLGTQG